MFSASHPFLPPIQSDLGFGERAPADEGGLHNGPLARARLPQDALGFATGVLSAVRHSMGNAGAQPYGNVNAFSYGYPISQSAQETPVEKACHL